MAAHMVEGRSKQAFKTWLAGHDAPWRDGVEVVAMVGFTGFKTAAAGEVPHADGRCLPARGDRRQGRELMVKLIDSISSGVPKALNDRLEHLRGSALGWPGAGEFERLRFGGG